MSKPINSTYKLRSLGAFAADRETYEDRLNLSDLEESEQDSEGEEPLTMSLNISMPPFHGAPGERADTWLNWFNNYADAHNFRDEKKKQVLPFFLKDHALAWFNSLDEEARASYDRLCASLIQRFNGNDGVSSDLALLTLNQHPGESCAAYFTRILTVVNKKQYPDSLITTIALKGLTDEIKNIVMPQNKQTLEELRIAATLAERTLASTASASALSVDAISRRVIESVTAQLVDVMALRSTSEPKAYQEPPQTWRRRDTERHGTDQRPCTRCEGKSCRSFDTCPATGRICSYCGKSNHYYDTCFKRKRDMQNKSQ